MRHKQEENIKRVDSEKLLNLLVKWEKEAEKASEEGDKDCGPCADIYYGVANIIYEKIEEIQKLINNE